MNENRTSSILQRLPVILAVTAASYGLTQANAARPGTQPGASKTAASRVVPQQQPAALPRR